MTSLKPLQKFKIHKMKKINIAELLRNCPKGMELDCTMFDNVTFEEVVTEIDCDGHEDISIVLLTHYNDGMVDEIILTEYGTYTYDETAKCVIFPKGKTTWEGFHKPFVEGDVIYVDDFIAILSNITENGTVWYHCYYCTNPKIFRAQRDFGIGNIKDGEFRFATEEEKAKLFQAIKENGYCWNNETKTLEKLPKFKIGDEIVKKNSISNSYIVSSVSCDYYGLILPNNTGVGVLNVSEQDEWEVISINKPTFKDGDIIYVCTEENNGTFTYVAILKQIEKGGEIKSHCFYNYEDAYFSPHNYLFYNHNTRFATEEEKAKLFKAIKDNGYKWNDETKTLEKLVTVFKVGDRIRHKENGIYCTLGEYSEGISAYRTNIGLALTSKDLGQWELAPNKFDINTLIPFESRVLVRNEINQLWIPAFFGYKRDNGYATTFGWSQYCIPFEGNEHLLNTANDCDNFFKVWEES